jgi:hypothetical protein
MQIASRLSAPSAIGLVLVLSGCGDEFDGRAVIRGKLVEGPNPFVLDQSKLKLPAGATAVPPGARPLAVIFIAEDKTQFQAVVNPETGAFELPGPDGKGIRPGRYKVAITCGVGGADYFNNKFAPDRTKVVRDVKEGEEVVIDVSQDG